jgi:hypothetical protein
VLSNSLQSLTFRLWFDKAIKPKVLPKSLKIIEVNNFYQHIKKLQNYVKKSNIVLEFVIR